MKERCLMEKPRLNPEKKFYLCLEGIRGIAAIIVAMRHIEYFAPVKTPMSFLAVDLFFVLSGFVLAYNYEEGLRSGATSVRSFVLNRLVRIYPLYILGTAIGVAVTLDIYGQRDIFRPLLFGILFLPDLPSWKAPLYPFNHPAWSLFAELAFGLIYARFLMKRSSLAVLITGLISFCLFCYAVFENGSADVGYQPVLFFFGLLRISFSFCAGVIIFRNRHFIADKAPLHRLKGNGLAIVIYGLTVAVLIAPLPRRLLAVSITYELLIIAVIFPSIVLFALQCEPTDSLAKISKLLGKISFPLYAIHAPLVVLTERVVGKDALFRLVPLSGIFMLALFVMVALLLERYFDAPIQRLRHGKSRARPVPVTTPVTDLKLRSRKINAGLSLDD